MNAQEAARVYKSRRPKIESKKMDDIELKEVWSKFIASKESGTPDEVLKNKLIAHYFPLTVQRVANKVHQRITEVPPDELASMGIYGLYDAVMGFDLNRKTKFETYATPRIRGAMLDEIRKADWIPRLVRSKCAWFEKQRQFYDSQAGYRLTYAELAEKIANSEGAKQYDINSEEDLEQFMASSTTPAVSSVDDDGDTDKRGGMPLDQAEDTNAKQPLDTLIREELFAKLMGSAFAPIERKIIWLYYFEDRSMKEISERVRLSESRVSQMHGMILRRLRQKAERNPDYFSDVWGMVSRFRGIHASVA